MIVPGPIVHNSSVCDVLISSKCSNFMLCNLHVSAATFLLTSVPIDVNTGGNHMKH